MFWFSSEWVLYLKNKQLVFFDPDKLRTLNLDFTPDIVSNLEVIDEKKLSEVLSEFLKNNKIKPNKAVTILSGEILFSKEIKDTSAETIDSFRSEVPFDAEKVVWKVLSPTEDKNIIVATNRSFFVSIVGLLNNLGWNIQGVYPQIILGPDLIASLTGNSVNKKWLQQIVSLTGRSKNQNFW